MYIAAVGTKVTNYQYDDNGNCIEKQQDSGKTTYEIDKNGNRSRKTYVDADGSFTGEYEWTYELYYFADGVPSWWSEFETYTLNTF